MRLSLVIPVFNETESLHSMPARLRTALAVSSGAHIRFMRGRVAGTRFPLLVSRRGPLS